MSITPKGLATTLKAACDRRATITATEEIFSKTGESSFFVHDNDGGILKVTVWQYKEPLR